MQGGFLERLKKGELMVADGPVHTILEQEQGRPLEGQLGQWIVDNQDKFQAVVKQTIEAGCDLAHAGTQGNGKYRLDVYKEELGISSEKEVLDKVYETTFEATRLTKEVTPEHCYVMGTIGISGRFLEPAGDMSFDEAYDSFKEQIIPMIDGGVDVIRIVENDTEQVVIAIKAAKDLCDLPVIGQNVFYPGKRGIRTLMGVEVKTATARLAEGGADVIGAVCGDVSPIGDALDTVKEMREACDKPLLMKPNPGMAELINNQIVWPVTPQEMAEQISDWIDAGASIVGGCCGASLDHLRLISAVVESKKK